MVALKSSNTDQGSQFTSEAFTGLHWITVFVSVWMESAVGDNVSLLSGYGDQCD